MTRTVLALALAAALLPAAASAAEPLSYRLQIVASPAGARGTTAERARRLAVPAHGAGSLLRNRGEYVAQVRGGSVAGLRATGARILNADPRYGFITVALARGELEAVSAVDGVQSVTEELTPGIGRIGGAGRATEGARLNTCTGARTSEANAQMRAQLAREDFELDGAGFEVGALSDSYDTAKNNTGVAPQPAAPITTAAGDVTSGDLPGPGNPCSRLTPVSVLEDFTSNANGTLDEGRAMIQHIHDIAPGAGLKFATAFTGEANFATNILALRNAGADVIVDDILYFNEPFFQDGIIANAVTQVNAAGVPYFSMAYNNNVVDGSGRDIASWETPEFRPVACPVAVANDNDFIPGSQCMDFDPGAGADSGFAIGVVQNRVLRVDLQWAEPINGVTTDLDAYLLNGAAISSETHTVNTTSQRPAEFVSLMAGSTGTRDLVIVRRPGAGIPRVKFMVQNNSGATTSFEYPSSGAVDTVGPAIYGHNGTAAAQTVGAIRFDTTSAPEAFSSRGPVTHYFGPVSGTTAAPPLAIPEVLSKPDVTATDGAANTFFGANVGGIRRFFGTSAAAPHAAAVAALQLQGNPALTPAQVKTAQTQTATAIGAPNAFGPFAIGAGLVDARGAVALNLLAPVLAASAPAATNDTTPDATFSANRPATFSCRVDAGPAATCTSPFTAPVALSEGAHTFTIVATDRAARTDTEVVPVKVDLTPPTANVVSGPGALTNVVLPTFTFASNEAGSTFQCRLDADAFAACTTAVSHTATTALGDGAHTFSVRAIDPAGNQGAAADSAFTVDTVPPSAPSVTGGPTGSTAETAPTFTFTTTDGTAFECRFDSAAFGACSGSGTHTPSSPLAAGAHTFEVRARDAAGNASTAGARAFSIVAPVYTVPTPTPTVTGFTPGDTVKPVLRFTKQPKKKTTKRKATFKIASSEPLAKLECKLDKQKFKSCKRSVTVKVKRGKHRFSARGTDAAGNVSKVIVRGWDVKKKQA